MSGLNATQGPGTPLRIGQEHIWRGVDKTNGFLMRSVDGRIPAMKQSFSRLDIGQANVLAAAGAVTWGNALWRDTSRIDVEPGVVHTEKPDVGFLCGILEFNQGYQTGHPVQNWGLPDFGRSDMICTGYVGYKVAMAAVGQEDNYLAYLQGDRSQDTDTVRTIYSDWMTDYATNGADGSRLGLFFANDSGFPIMSVIAAADVGSPTLAGATFAGLVEIFEPENESVYVSFGIGR
jgi:hypothetical protein